MSLLAAILLVSSISVVAATQSTFGTPHSIAKREVQNQCQLGQEKMNQCNNCTCKEINGVLDWSCEQNVCMFSNDVIQGLEKDLETWRGVNYTQYYNRTLSEMLKYRLGTFPITERAIRRIKVVRYNYNITYPIEYNNKMPRINSRIRDQGWCGSDWAMAIVSVLTDRYAIQSNGTEAVELSPQSLLSCNRRHQEQCSGGHIDRAWNYIKLCGLVDEECYPYDASESGCPYTKRATLLDANCHPLNPNRTTRYKAGQAYRLVDEKDIMWEIMNNGPVHAVMTVYQDFFHYSYGVYRHTKHGDQVQMGLHSVKIVGWGVRRPKRSGIGEPYWTVANSWGSDWGVGGYFNIPRGVNESGIEYFVIGAESKFLPEKIGEGNMH